MTSSLQTLLARFVVLLRTSRRWGPAALFASAALLIAVTSIIAVRALLLERQNEQAEAAAVAQRLARSANLLVEQLLASTDEALAATAEELTRRFANGRIDERSTTRYLDERLDHVPDLASLYAYDEDGDPIALPAEAPPFANVADRDFFVQARERPAADLVAGSVSPSRVEHRWAWPLVRRITDTDGSFEGIVLATLKPDVIRRLFDGMRLGHEESVELRDPGMALVARAVFDAVDPVPFGDTRMSVASLEAMRAAPNQGYFVSDTYADPVVRIYAYLRSPRYGYYVLVGIPFDTALAEWHKGAWPVLILLGALIASVIGFCWTIRSGWRRHEYAMAHIRNSERSLNQAMEIAMLGSFVYDLRDDEWACSETFEKMFGIDESYPRDMVHWLKLVHPEARDEVRAQVNRLVDQGVAFDLEYRIVRPADGQERWVHCACRLGQDRFGKPTSIVGTYQDITVRKAAEETINKLAFFDQLTGLANRTLLLDRLRQAMSLTNRSGNTGAVLLIDLDNFKTLNDIHGHQKGDLLLKQVAHRLTACVRAEDTVARPVSKNTVARLGGDEFVVVLPNLSGTSIEDAAAQAKVIASRILFTLNQSYELDGVSFVGTASIGVTLFRGKRSSIADLLKQADLAMYRAKASGRDAACFFDADLEATVMKRAILEGHLRRALELKEFQFELHYQAQVVGEGRVTGAEVLVRWEHPVLGAVSPAEFIPVAEESNLILPLGKWVLETACHQLAAWALVPEFMNLTLAVNVSAHQFYQADFVEQVRNALAESKARAHLLKLELTESLLLRDVDEIIRKMNALKEIGVGFALDDFGTGYSSLVYLKRLPLDQLKIDKTFVRDVLIDPNDAAIARTVAALGQTLGLTVIAEGVENEAQRDFLAQSGCHAYQGYFISRPLPVEEFEEFARRAWERDNERFLYRHPAVVGG